MLNKQKTLRELVLKIGLAKAVAIAINDNGSVMMLDAASLLTEVVTLMLDDIELLKGQVEYAQSQERQCWREMENLKRGQSTLLQYVEKIDGGGS